MAEYEERSNEDLTEEPSQHRIEELRTEGIVTHSRELTNTIVFIGALACLYFLSQNFLQQFSGFLKEVFTKDLLKPLEVTDWRSFMDIGGRAAKLLVFSILPLAAICITLGILGSALQIGFLFSPNLIEPDFNRINPVDGILRLVSMNSLLIGLKAILKFIVITGAVYLTVSADILVLPETVSYGSSQLLTYIGSVTIRVFSIVAILLLAIAGLDYWIQWMQYRKRAMLTKQEAKRELKEREGDPQIKARIRSIQRDIARKRMMKAVPKADLIITNPTHIAIAIEYKAAEMVAPKVVAKGADFLANRIKEIARSHNIPIVENKPLARSLYKTVKVGQMIPRSLYQAVAEILAYVYRLKGKRLSSASMNVMR